MTINTRLVQVYRVQGLWWFRVMGYGLHCKDIRYHPLIFSQRDGRDKNAVTVKHWRIGLLKPIY